MKVQRTGDGNYRRHRARDRAARARYDLDNEDALAHLEAQAARGIGVIGELEAKGFQAGTRSRSLASSSTSTERVGSRTAFTKLDIHGR